jgi:hypothetical protein
MSRSVVILVRPGGRTATVLGWLRRMLPAAILLVSSANFTEVVTSEVIVLEDVDVDSGPLALADAVHRRLGNGLPRA